MAEGPALLEVRNLCKRYPGGVHANREVSLVVQPGEIHALLGENGAGKSTLVKAVYGALHPDSGTMDLDGAPFAPRNPAEARARGVGMVFQHFALFDTLSVRDNIALSLPPDRSGRGLDDHIALMGERYGLHLSPARLVGELSVGERQRVEILRALLQEPRLLIMDEPTSVLTPQEAEQLFVLLRQIAAEGRAVLYISHKLEEIRALCSQATIMRQGRVVARCDPRQASARDLAEMMIGADLPVPERKERPVFDRIRLELDRLTVAAEGAFGVGLNEISLTVRAGEIVGIAGMAGNGQRELIEALAGVAPTRAAAIRLDERHIGALAPLHRRNLGLACVPEERVDVASVAAMSLADNMFLAINAKLGLVRRGWRKLRKARDFAKVIISENDVRGGGPNMAARLLSGGNLQKFIVGRAFVQQPEVLVVAQPTWGVDAGAAAAIHQSLLDHAAQGAAILVISQDLDELLALSDRIAVLAGGRLSSAEPVANLTPDQIGRAMGGDFVIAEVAE